MQIAVTMDLYREFITTIGMFENVRNLATTEQQIKYQNILQEVHHEKALVATFMLMTFLSIVIPVSSPPSNPTITPFNHGVNG